MLSQIFYLKKHHPRFLALTISLLFLYGLQFLLRSEITPFGYFSMYSDPAQPLKFYTQIIPADSAGKPIDIYNNSWSSSFMFETLPARYNALIQKKNCSQFNYKLAFWGLQNQANDCENLKPFKTWFVKYAHATNLDLPANYKLINFGFKNAQLINNAEIILP